MSKKTYTLTMSEEQAQVAVRALDLYTRIGIGQFEEAFRVYDPLNSELEPDERRGMEILVTEVKRLYGHPMNQEAFSAFYFRLPS